MRVWRTLLSPHYGRYRIVAEAADTRQMLCAAASLQPAVVVMDAGLAGKRPAVVVQELCACAANTKLLICWQYRHERLVQPLLGLPVSLLAEDAATLQMIRALNQLMRGAVYHCRQSERLVHPPATVARVPEQYRQLLWCMWQGHSAEEMSVATRLTVRTVNSYLKEIHALIGSRSMGALDSFMKKQGMGGKDKD
jgi:DNA-binding NarL/FixJ family response regulator